MEPLIHNRANAVTAGIWRVLHNDGTAIKKVLSPHPRSDTPPHWLPSNDPSHFNFWRREAHAYEARIGERFAGSGLRMPELLELTETDSGEVVLLLEDVRGTTGSNLTLGEYASIGLVLGRAQGMFAAQEPLEWYPWLSRDFIGRYPESKPYAHELLYEDAAWDRTLINDNWDSSLRVRLILLHERRHELRQLIRRVPRTLCHLDFWPNNLFVTPEGELVPVDWSFCGDGALGEDIGNLIPDAVFDLLVPSAKLEALENTVFENYVQGLTEGGWAGDERWVRLGMCASSVKYHWLGPMMLANAAKTGHRAYGGSAESNPALQYRERGSALEMLCDWMDEAFDLAKALGI